MSKDHFNSRRYHSFFEGYTETVVKENGKQKIRRIYTGDYYQAEIPEEQQKRIKIRYALLYLAAVGCFLFVCLQGAQINLSRIAAICQGVLLILFLWMGVSIFDYLRRKKKITLYIYRSSSGRLLLLTKAAVIVLAVLFVRYIIGCFLEGGSSAEILKILLGTAICFVSVLLIYRTEAGISYTQIESEEIAPKDGKRFTTDNREIRDEESIILRSRKGGDNSV